MNDKIKVLVSEEDVNNKIREIGAQITKDCANLQRELTSMYRSILWRYLAMVQEQRAVVLSRL